MSAKFDTLKFAEELEAAGLSRDLTRKRTSLLHDDALGSVATKQDLKELEHTLTIRFGGIIALAVGIIIAAQKLI